MGIWVGLAWEWDQGTGELEPEFGDREGDRQTSWSRWMDREILG